MFCSDKNGGKDSKNTILINLVLAKWSIMTWLITLILYRVYKNKYYWIGDILISNLD
jgi:hypothetical protein